MLRATSAASAVLKRDLHMPNIPWAVRMSACCMLGVPTGAVQGRVCPRIMKCEVPAVPDTPGSSAAAQPHGQMVQNARHTPWKQCMLLLCFCCAT